MNPLVAPFSSFRLTALPNSLIAAAVLPLILGSCGKKEEAPAPAAPAPAPVEETHKVIGPAPVDAPAPNPAPAPAPAAPTPGMREPEAAPAPVATPAPATPAPTPEPTPATPAPAPTTSAAPAERAPEDAAAWQRWDRAAERMRDIGATVKPSTDPLRLEAAVELSVEEARIVARNAFNVLGSTEGTVVLVDGAGVTLAEVKGL